jgi:hypothetical protein
VLCGGLTHNLSRRPGLDTQSALEQELHREEAYPGPDGLQARGMGRWSVFNGNQLFYNQLF